MKYYGSDGTVYEIISSTERKGGEGSIYDVVGKPHLVLKIYHKNDVKRSAKITELVKQSRGWDGEFRKWTVPPIDYVYDENKAFVGYIMKKLTAKFKPLAEIYDRDVGGGISFSNKVRVAMNLCSVTMLAHRNKVVIGDYNQKNIGIDSHGFVTLFDNDSFQFSSGKKVYRCTVGVPEEMAPEIFTVLRDERTDLERVSRPVYNEYTDCYTLALHVFHLLMNGAHPFNSKIDASKLPPSKTVSSAIVPVKIAAQKGLFYIANPDGVHKKPDWVPEYDILSPALKELFERAFVDGLNEPEKRPTPEDFFTALSEYLPMLEKLPCGHWQYKGYSGGCEWCKVNG